jgi:hypothetical protein
VLVLLWSAGCTTKSWLSPVEVLLKKANLCTLVCIDGRKGVLGMNIGSAVYLVSNAAGTFAIVFRLDIICY